MAKESCVIELDDDIKTEAKAMDEESWVIVLGNDISSMMKRIPAPIRDIGSISEQCGRRSIPKVPQHIRDLKKESFQPQTISFGPYHHGDKHLATMEEHKERTVARFLNRSERPLELLLDSLAKVVQELKDAYYPLDESWKGDNRKFLLLMITDGCFMAEILHTAKHGFDGYPSVDPVFSKHGKRHIIPFIARDMLKLENQLPMMLLCKLFAFLENKSEEEVSATICELIINFFRKVKYWEVDFESWRHMPNLLKNSPHILDVFRLSLLHKLGGYQPSQEKQFLCKSLRLSKDCCCNWFWSFFPGDADSRSIAGLVPSVTELQEAGIQFRRSKTRSLEDISFRDGILRLPQIWMDETTEFKIRNLQAFEYLHVPTGDEVTSYVSFMDNLIDSTRDVEILMASGIIKTGFASNGARAVASLICDVSESEDMQEFRREPLKRVQKEVNSHFKRYSYRRSCGRRCNTWRTVLVEQYFTSPWSCISLLAAVVLFALTAVQTYYAAYPYHGSHPK